MSQLGPLIPGGGRGCRPQQPPPSASPEGDVGAALRAPNGCLRDIDRAPFKGAVDMDVDVELAVGIDSCFYTWGGGPFLVCVLLIRAPTILRYIRAPDSLKLPNKLRRPLTVGNMYKQNSL